MFRILIIACCTWAFAASQGQFDYFYDYDAPVEVAPAPQVAPRPPPPQAVQPQTRSKSTRPRSQVSRPPPVQKPSRLDPLDADSLTTPVPIVKDTRRIDTKTGAFVYEYAGADGSAKHEYRYPNGTVVGNYTFINDLGERETRFYSAGVHDPTLVDETTDPNYVDLGNYDLYKHLEQPYIHTDGAEVSEREFLRPRPQQAGRPRAQSSRPAARPSAPRPVAPRPAPPPPPPPPRAQIPLDFNDETALFQQAPAGAPVFDYEDVAVPAHLPPPGPPVPVAAPVPVAQPVPVAPSPHFIPSQSSRGRQGGRARAQAPARGPPHRLDFSGQLDSIINRFN